MACCFGLHAQTRTKADFDGNGLIEIRTLTELNNIRNDLDGSHYNDGTNPAINAGCPGTGCKGYELVADLDFRAGCGMSTAASDCDYPNWVPKDGSGNLVTPANGTNAGWTPIGHRPVLDDEDEVIGGVFTGTFDGHHHTIANLYVNLASTANDTDIYAGLFGYLKGALKNLGLTGEHMAVRASATHTGSAAYAGGLVGDVEFAINRITNCYATGNVSASASSGNSNTFAGGLAGYADRGITNCYATGDVSASAAVALRYAYAGGLVGYTFEGKIENCYATGRVTSTSPSRNRAIAGGVVGEADTDSVASYYSGEVKEATSSGGLSSADAIQTAGQYKTLDQLKALTAGSYDATNNPNGSGWSANDWVFVSGKLPSLKLCGQSSDHVQCPEAPTLAQKASALTQSAQVYTATFTGGTLYYLLRQGEKSVLVTKANVRSGTSPVGTNKGMVAANASPKEVSLSSLTAETKYTLYALVEAGNGLQSGLVAETFTTKAVPPDPPGLTQKASALTHVAQTYTATFTGGTLYYLLRQEAEDSSVSAAQVKAGTSVVGANKGMVAANASPKEVSLSSLTAQTQYTLYAMVEAGNGLQSGVVAATFTTKAVPPDRPGLTQKASALTHNAQVYTATFSGGTLYYLLRQEAEDSSVSAAQVKAGTSPVVGTNKGMVAANASPKEVSLSSLTAQTQYTLYAIVEVSGQSSSVAAKTFTTAAAPLAPPTLPEDRAAPDAPTLTAKAGSLARNSQTYVATFDAGTLYHLLQPGGYSSSVTATHIKAGTSGGTESPKDVVLSPLQSATQYTLYAIIEHNNAQSVVASETFTTLVAPVQPPGDEAAPDPPTLTARVGSLTRNAQTYTAAFMGGRLYYLLRQGVKDSNVSVADVKAGTSAVGGNKGNLARSGDIALSNLSAGTQYTLYAFVEASDEKKSPLAMETFMTAAAPPPPDDRAAPDAPAKPVLMQKADALTARGQVYTATFARGTLYYVLRRGEKDSNVSVADIKDGTDAVGTNKGMVAANASPKEIILSGLGPRTEYTLYAMVEASGDVDLQSEVVAKTFTTVGAPVGISTPSYTLGTPTKTTIFLTGGSGFRGGADRRRFYVSKSDLGMLEVTSVSDGKFSGVEGEVWTFVLSEGLVEVAIGSGTPEGNKALEAGTRYYVRVIDYSSSDGRKSVLSANLGATTALGASVQVLSALSSVPHAHPNPTSGTFRVPVSEGRSEDIRLRRSLCGRIRHLRRADRPERSARRSLYPAPK